MTSPPAAPDPPGTDPRVDELRQRLRALGYLDAGVDRFVLGPARETRPPAMIAWLASLRVGALAALLLGPAAALGLMARIPGLVTQARDAIVVALYLGAFFGAVVIAVSFVASMLAYWLARRAGTGFVRRGRSISRAAGAAVTVGCAAYLTLWWQTVIAGLGWSAPVWTLSALALAVAMSLLLGHAVAVASTAVVLASANQGLSSASKRLSSASRRKDAADSAGAKSSWRRTLATAAIVFGAAALLLTWSGDAARGDASSPREALTVVPSGLRLRVIAIDGFDPRIFDDLATAGRVPTLAPILGRAPIQLESRPGDAGDPARVWTTIATGQPPEVHAVQGLETRRVAGVQGSVAVAAPSPLGRAMRGATDLVRLTRPAIASGSERRAKTFWEIAAEAGLRTSVVNWWATWPALPHAGVVLTDRATLRLERGGNLDAEIAPPELYDTLRQQWPDIKARVASQVDAALTSSDDESIRAIMRRSAELDALQLVLSAQVTTDQTDLSAVYLPGLDIAQNALLGASQNGEPTQAPSAVALRLDALRTYYVALDRLLAPALEPAVGEVVMIVTEPGRIGRLESGAGNNQSASMARLAVSGGPVQSPAVPGRKAAATSVAATVLYALGVPIGRDLAGAALLDLFNTEFTARYPMRYVATYGRPTSAPVARTGQPLDEEMVERLRSLGYVR